VKADATVRRTGLAEAHFTGKTLGSNDASSSAAERIASTAPIPCDDEESLMCERPFP
jgi:hypothetical protein